MPADAEPRYPLGSGESLFAELHAQSLRGWWPLGEVLKAVRKRGARRVVTLWLASVGLSVAAGIAVVRFDLSAVPLPLGVMTLDVTIYPPLLVGMLLFLWLGPTWAIAATYVATLALGGYAGLSTGANLAFALADPVLFLVVWGGITVLDMPSEIRTRPHLVFFLALVLTGAVASSLGALIWNYSHGLPFVQGIRIWEGWVVGAFLHGALLALPIHYFAGGRARAWLERELEMPPRQALGPRGGAILLSFALVLVAVIAGAVIRLLLGDLQPIEQSAVILAERLPDLALFAALVFGSIIGTTVLLTIAMTRRSERELTLARMDGLTGCLNRVAFGEIFPREAGRSVRLTRPLAIVFIDLDHFKQINDDYGYATGDFVLREVAARVSSMIRGTDYLFRWGGEEFVLLLPHSTGEEAEHLADRVRKEIKRGPFQHVAARVSVTASLGVAAAEEPSSWSFDLVNEAANACRTAKRRGRDSVETQDSATRSPSGA